MDKGLKRHFSKEDLWDLPLKLWIGLWVCEGLVSTLLRALGWTEPLASAHLLPTPFLESRAAASSKHPHPLCSYRSAMQKVDPSVSLPNSCHLSAVSVRTQSIGNVSCLHTPLRLNPFTCSIMEAVRDRWHFTHLWRQHMSEPREQKLWNQVYLPTFPGHVSLAIPCRYEIQFPFL